jgi:hypothetical protein
MPIQIIPRSAEKQPFWLNFLFYFSLLLAISAASSYFILGSMTNKAEKTYDNLVLQLSQTATQQEASLEKQIFDYKKKIDNFSLILNNKRYSSQVFPFIEKMTHPKVSFSSFKLDAVSGEVSLIGKTDNFQTLAQQMAVFKNEKSITKLTLSGLSAEKDGRLSFNLDFILDQGFFKKNE